VTLTLAALAASQWAPALAAAEPEGAPAAEAKPEPKAEPKKDDGGVEIETDVTEMERLREKYLWTLDLVEISDPTDIVVKDPLTDRDRRYWYVRYVVKNNTGADRRYVPRIELVALMGKARKVYPEVMAPAAEAKVERNFARPYLNSGEMAGLIVNGAEKHGIAFFNPPDARADRLELVFQGLTNQVETQGSFTEALNKALQVYHEERLHGKGPVPTIADMSDPKKIPTRDKLDFIYPLMREKGWYVVKRRAFMVEFKRPGSEAKLPPSIEPLKRVGSKWIWE